MLFNISKMKYLLQLDSSNTSRVFTNQIQINGQSIHAFWLSTQGATKENMPFFQHLSEVNLKHKAKKKHRKKLRRKVPEFL